MKWNRKSNKTILRSQRILLPLIVLAVLLAILALTSTVKPAYADSPPDEWIWPGEGGGGGGGTQPVYKIDGVVFNLQGGYASGVKVRIYTGTIPAFLLLIDTEITDSLGRFSYYDQFGYYIHANTYYRVTVNGARENLGISADDPSWCQWANVFQTDSRAYAYFWVNLDASKIVKVVSAAMYSNSQYATLKYFNGSSTNYYHSTSFNVGTFGVSNGFLSGTIEEHWASCDPMYKGFMYRHHYALSYVDACMETSQAGIVKKPGEGWGTYYTTEYISDPGALDPQYCEDFTCAKGLPTGGEYTETGSTTWSANGGPRLGILFEAFGVPINIDVTVRSETGYTNTLAWATNISTSPHKVIHFRVYRIPGEIHIFETGWEDW
jgi:hypothetical protein